MTQPAKQKVLLLITKSNFGGAQRYVYDLATGLDAEQFDVTVAFGPAPDGKPGRLAAMLEQANIRTILIRTLKRDVGLLRDLRAFFALITLLRRERPNILHLNSSKAAGLGALAGRLTGVPRIIYTAHGWPFWEERLAPVRALIFLFSWLTVLFSHSTICVSDFDRLQLRRFPFMRTRLVTIPNGIAPIDVVDRSSARATLFDTETAAFHARHVWVATVAELHPNKNLERAIDAVIAYNRRHDIKIFYSIIGAGELEATLTAKADKDIAILGFVPSAARYLKAFDIFFLPSLKEGVPYVVLEAGAAGLPVVASDVGGIPEILAGTVDGHLINPKDVDSMVHGLHDATASLAHPSSALANTVGNTVRLRYALRAMIERTANLYLHERT